MTLEKILAISGKPGLFVLENQLRNGVLATSLLDGKKTTIGVKNNVSLLSEIAIYTTEEEVALSEIFQAILKKENTKPTSVSHKASKKELEHYFAEILPLYDRDRVYASDIKKVIQWYNLLLEHGYLSAEHNSSETQTER